MNKIRRKVGRSFLTRVLTIATTTLVVLAVMCIGLTAVAQIPSPLPGQVGQQTVMIMGTGHDFADGAGPYQDKWVGAGDNMCTPCHGVPAAGGPTSAPVWNHAYDVGTHNASTWLYTKHDGSVAFDDLSDKCLGCHDGTNTLQDYTGYSPQYVEPVGVPAAITAFSDSVLNPGDDTVVHSAAHGLLGGEHVDITGTANYDGQYVVIPGLNVNEFEIAEEFVATETGSWQEMDPALPEFVGGNETLGVTLSNTHHPVGIEFTAAMGAAEEYLVDPTTTHYAEGTIATMLLNGDGRINCNSCHEQHNDRRFDLAGGDYHDDPVLPYNADSELHNFLKIYEGGCRLCHTSGSVAAAKGSNDHHFPGREDPRGDLRGGNPFSCTKCHNVGGDGGHHRCSDCHIVNGVPQYDPLRDGIIEPFMATGHHGGDRELPYINCAPCHGDPVTGILTGNDFGGIFAPSCFECHADNKWAGDDVLQPTWGTPPVEGIVMVGGKPTLDGTVDELVTFQANATDNEGDPLAYTWSFGDGSLAQFPSFDNVTSHAYDVHNFQPRNKPLNPPYNAVVSVTDGKTPPIFYEFQVRIYEAEEHVADTWTVTPSTDPEFDITFENHSGSLVGWADRDNDSKTPDQLSFGVEFVGVIFWMDMWMDISGNAFWGTGDMFFGNMKRGDPGTMRGVLFKADGSVQTFTGSGGAAPGGH